MKKFKLLVLGDACLNNQPTTGPSYVSQLTRRLAREGLRVTVDCYTPLTLTAITGLLPRLPLQQYDLIVLLPGHAELQRPVSLRDLFADTAACCAVPGGRKTGSRQRGRWLQPLRDAVVLTGLRLLAGLAGIHRLQQTRRDLRMALDGLQPCGHNVVLVTPFPHRDPISNWLRRKGRRVFLEEGRRAFMPVFDAYTLLDVGDVCFIPGDPSTLNALGHELVGSALYDFFRAGVQVVDDSSSYRRHE